MILQHTQKSMTSASRRSLGVLAIFWLNLALMPCTMALESADVGSDCPPPAVEVMSQHQHHTMPEAAEPAADCLAMQSGCCAVADIALDTRTTIEKSGGDDIVVITAPPSWPPLVTFAAVERLDRPPNPHGHYPRIHVINCVYLD